MSMPISVSSFSTSGASTATAPAGDSGDLGLRLPLHGLRLIEASAGTGKTFALVTVLLRLVLERGAPLSEVVAVTFTRAAAQELRARLRQRLQAARKVLAGSPEDADDAEARAARTVLTQAGRDADRATLHQRLEAALLQLDEALVSTIHGFCQRVLREFGFRVGVLADAQLVDAAPEAWAEVAAQLWRRAARGEGDAQALHALLRAVWKTPAALAKDLPALCDPARALLPTPEDSDPDAPEAADHAAALHALQRDAQRVFAEVMARRGERTQDQLIAAVWQAARREEVAAALAERWPRLLIDEFQDTDPRQWDIFRAMYDAAPPARRLLCLIGDPKQAIYRFRGGDLETYLHARQRVRDAQARDGDAGDAERRLDEAGEYALDANYRSRPDLLRALDVVFAMGDARQADATQHAADAATDDASSAEGIADPFRDARIAYHPLHAKGSARDTDLRVNGAAEPALTLHWLDAPEPDRTQHHSSNAHKGFREKDDELALMCGAAVAQIARLLADGTLQSGEGDPRPLRPGDIAVLTRSNDEAMRMHRALADAGLPSALLSKDGVFQSEVAEMLRSVLRALAAPEDIGLFRAALATPLLGFDAPALLALEHDPARFDAQWTHFERAAALWRSRGPLPALLPFATAAAERWLQEQGGARRMTDLLHLLELLQAEAPQQHGPLELLRWLETQIDAPGDAAETRQLRLEADADLIQIGTIHRAKGLEYPVVVLPFAAWTSGSPPKSLRRFDLHVDPHVERHADPAAAAATRAGDEADAAESTSGARGDRVPTQTVPARVWTQKEVLVPRDLKTLQDASDQEDAQEAQRLLYVALTRARNALHIVWSRNRSTEDTALHWLLHRGARMGRKADTLDAAGMRARLDQLQRDAGGAIAVRDVNAERLPVDIAETAARAARRLLAQATPAPARETAHRFRIDPRLHSFSSLHARLAEGEPPQPGEGADHDAERGAADEAAVLAHAPLPPADNDSLGGSGFGNAVHEVLEAADFAAWAPESSSPSPDARAASRGKGDARRQGDLFASPPDGGAASVSLAPAAPWPASQQPLLERALRRAGVSPTPSHLGQTARLVRAALTVPLPGGVRLHALPASRCVRELGFHFRLRPTRMEALFALLAAHGYPRPQRAPAETLAGFMHGWIDLVYRDDAGRHYVLDYKTNRLPAYDPAGLARAVRRSDYDLQYLIYLVALYRWLRLRRGAAFDPRRDLGGAVYVFLRGVEGAGREGASGESRAGESAGGSGSGTESGTPGVLSGILSGTPTAAADAAFGIAAGVHFDPVSPALLAALDVLFDGAPSAAGEGTP